MKSRVIILVLLTVMVSTVQARVIKAKDGYRGGHRSSNPLISTVEASSEASFQMSIAISIEVMSRASSEATSRKNERVATERTALDFLDNNSVDIKKDISKGGGEHLITLLTIMEIKRDSKMLSKIQADSDSLIGLDGTRLIDRLRDISKL